MTDLDDKDAPPFNHNIDPVAREAVAHAISTDWHTALPEQQRWWRYKADDAITAYLATRHEQVWVEVPREPTEVRNAALEEAAMAILSRFGTDASPAGRQAREAIIAIRALKTESPNG